MVNVAITSPKAYGTNAAAHRNRSAASCVHGGMIEVHIDGTASWREIRSTGSALRRAQGAQGTHGENTDPTIGSVAGHAARLVVWFKIVSDRYGIAAVLERFCRGGSDDAW
jgi:hypothetical protein